jgi:methionyl-tRNA formyltransferase
MQRKEPSRPARSALPLINATLQSSVLYLAWSRHIPVWEVHRLEHADVIATLAAYQPDIICVACFSQRIPRSMIELPRLGCLNVHPSLLPSNRGPVPLFWTFREEDEKTGVTIHFIDENMDAGDILAQEPLPVPEGINYTQLELRCAQRGGQLLAQSIWELCQDKATRMPQDEAKSSYHGFPVREDFVIHATTYGARHVYNFIRAVGHWDEPIKLHANGKILLVRDAFSYSLYKDMPDASSPESSEQGGNGTWVRCKDGWVQVVISLF